MTIPGVRTMLFALRMARRELRAAWGRLLFFFLCVAIGVAAIVVLRSVMQDIRDVLTREARDLVGADVVVQSFRSWTDEQRARIQETVGGAGAPSTNVIETQTMAALIRGEDVVSARLVEVRAVEPGFPFYGKLDLADGQPYSHALLEKGGALVQPEVLAQLGANVGDQLRLAGRLFTVRGVVSRDRVQRAGGFALGPRIYLDLADLAESPILGFGSRATYRIFLKVDAPIIDRATRQIRRMFRNDLATVRSWRGVEDRLGRNLTLAENYLSLVGFAIVVLGGIGVWSVTRVFVHQRRKSVAILKCLGATSSLVLSTYLVQMACLAMGGSLIGIALAGVALRAIPARVLTPLNLTAAHMTWSAAAQGIAVGVLVSLMFALLPLLDMRRVKPFLLLRSEAAAPGRRRDWPRIGAAAAMSVSLVLVAIWQADSLRAGLYVCAGLAIVGLALLGASHLLVRVTKPLTRSRRFAIRHAAISFGRQGNQTRVVLLAVGLGCFFIMSMRALQVNLLAEFNGQIGRNAPDLLLIDIQPDQVAGVRALVGPYVTQPVVAWPMMRARVVGVEGRRTQLPNPDAVRRQGRLTREFGITFRDGLEDNERLLDGTFWSGPLAASRVDDRADTEVSIEEQVHTDSEVDLGDVMRFDIGGRVVSARVTSIRKVAWDEAQNGGFVFVFRPGPAIERAPHVFVGFLKVSAGPEPAGTLQRDMVRAFPNVSVIDVRGMLASIREVIDNAALGVTVVGAVTLFGGMLILLGAVAVTKFQRLYEAAIYRTLGASTRMIASMTAVEYGMLGALAGVLGAAGAFGLSWAVATQLLEIDWQPAPGLLAAGAAFTGVVVCAAGVLASLDVLFTKPLNTLRNE